MNTEITHLTNRLENYFKETPWYGKSLFATLNKIDWALVNQRPKGTENSIARLVQHLLNWRIFTLDKLQETKENTIYINLVENWTDTTISSKQEWKQLLQKMEESHLKIVTILQNKEDAFLDIKTNDGYTHRFLIEGTIQHDIYHLGQISLIAKQVS